MTADNDVIGFSKHAGNTYLLFYMYCAFSMVNEKVRELFLLDGLKKPSAQPMLWEE